MQQIWILEAIIQIPLWRTIGAPLNCSFMVPLVCELFTFENNTGQTDGQTDGRSDGHDLIKRCDGASKNMGDHSRTSTQEDCQIASDVLTRLDLFKVSICACVTKALAARTKF